MAPTTDNNSTNEPETPEFEARIQATQRRLAAELQSSYDFIVCGSGSSGSVVARRLAESDDVSVLLLEAGGTDDLPSVRDAGQWLANVGTERDWGFQAAPNRLLNGRRLSLSAGKVLGGSSSINAMIWSRGHKNDWEYFAEEAGDPRWRYESVLGLYRRLEDWQGSPHYSGPDFGFPRGDARLDFTDLYAFPKPEDPRKSILVMNVHPSAVVTPPGPTTAEPFAPEALYELRINTNGDAVADIAYRVRFSAFDNGSQSTTLRRVEGVQAAGIGDGGQVIVASARVSTGRDARVTEAGEYRFFAGWRSDPFFFDVHGMLNNQQFTGDDFFADKNVCSIVLEVPNSVLGTNRVSLWARTLVGAVGGWVQVDRGALPAQAVFLVGTERDCVHDGRACGRRPLRFRLRTRSGAHGWVCTGRGKASGTDTAARRAVL